MTFQELSSSFGSFPRTFAINRAGDLVAIGDQNSSMVVIVKRDPNTGRMGDMVAKVQLGSQVAAGSFGGLSSVIWDE